MKDSFFVSGRWHAFMMSLVLVETILLLTVLAADRFLAVKFPLKHDSSLSPCRMGILLSITWIQALAFSFPFLTDVVKMQFWPRLHSCSVSDETPLAFICLASVLCFLLPLVIIVVLLILTCHACYKQSHEIKSVVSKKQYTDQLMSKPRSWHEMQSVKYVIVLCILWSLLDLPYVIIIYIQQYTLSKELSFSVTYPWGVDVGFMYTRFSFSAALPCVTFIFNKCTRSAK